MSVNKKYYYLKLKENFYNTDDIKLLEAMPNGYEYSSFYLKLCLMSLKEEGKLVFKGRIPYKPEMLSTITGHNIDIVKVALETFHQMEMISLLDGGTIFINDIQALIGKSSSEAERKNKYRKRIDKEKQILISDLGQCPTFCPPEKEKEKEKEKEIKLELEKKKEKNFFENVSVPEVRKKRKKRQPSQKQIIEEQNKNLFIKKVSDIYPKDKTDKEGFKRLEYFYESKILTKQLDEQTFIQNLTSCIELKSDYMFILKNYVGTDSKNSKNYYQDNWVEKLEYNKKSTSSFQKKKASSGERINPQHAHSGNVAQEMKEKRLEARANWIKGIKTPGYHFPDTPFGSG